MSIKIIFCNDSIYNTTASCDSLGIHYTFSAEGFPDVVTRIERWDRETNQNVLVAQIQVGEWKDGIRWAGDSDWRPLEEFMWRGTSSGLLYTARTFQGNNRINYRWKIKLGKLQLYYASKDAGTEPLIRYHRNFLRKDLGCLDIFNSSVVGSLDNIIVSFLVTERKRRGSFNIFHTYLVK
ncbi:hypothetical protein CPB86DRAFT_800088 [Serendipita vermifera]|nr:hypothetical protein CPB86DRAFT_800088 [Serendipita vermifera]